MPARARPRSGPAARRWRWHRGARSPAVPTAPVRAECGRERRLVRSRGGPVWLTAIAAHAYRRILRMLVAAIESATLSHWGWPADDRRAARAAPGHGPRAVARLQRPHERVVLPAAC